MRKLFILAALSLAPFLFEGCNSVIGGGWEVDWYPVEIYIYATDSDGNSIISPDMEGMNVYFRGLTYNVKDWGEGPDVPDESATKAYFAVLYGLYAQPGSVYGDEGDPYRLWFGEISGAEDMDEDFVLNWPDGSTDTIHYHCSDHKEGPHPSCTRTWRLNGKPHEGSVFTFTGKSL